MKPLYTPQRGRDALQHVARALGQTPDVLCGTSQKRSITDSRQFAIAAILNTFEASLHEMGELFRRDHTTIIHSRDRVAQRVARDQDAAKLLNVLVTVARGVL